jgi:hypothetical protein
MHDFIDGFLQRMSLGDKGGQLNHANAQSETTTGVGVAVSGGTAALDRVLPGGPMIPHKIKMIICEFKMFFGACV